MAKHIEFIFRTDKGLSDMLAALGQRNRWVVREFRGPMLCSVVAEDVRIRISTGYQSGQFELLAFWQSDEPEKKVRAEVEKHVLRKLDAADIKPLHGSFVVGRECAVFLFESDVEIAEAAETLGGVNAAEWTHFDDDGRGEAVRAVSMTRDPVEELRWRLARHGARWALEITYDATEHDEATWRKAYRDARDSLLPALAAEVVSEPEEWSIPLERFRGQRAWAFKSADSLIGLREKLAAAWPHRWRMTDKHWTRDCLTSTVTAVYSERTKVRVAEIDGALVLDVVQESEHPRAAQKWTEFCDRMTRELLPAIGASAVAETEPVLD